jgi:alpha-1,6-mannosyltransferase
MTIGDQSIPKYVLIGTIVLVLLTTAIAYWPQQGDFLIIRNLYIPAFLLYYWLYREANHATLPFLLGAAFLMRLVIGPAMPQLSDDIYRFIWDGRLIINGINPFEYLPAHYMEMDTPPAGLTSTLFDQLNSPEYFTIYPPVAQGIFAIACWIFPNSIYGSTMVMKLFLIIFEGITIYLLPKFLKQLGLNEKNALLYVLNPLVIVEVVGNLHFEGAMVCFLLLSFWWIAQQKWMYSAIAMGLSIASKLLPLLFLVFFIRRLGWKQSIRYFIVVGVTVLLLFAPLLGEAFFSGFGTSLDLYFRRFEFNGSIYYLARWIGYEYSGHNLIAFIGPSLALGTFLIICTTAIVEKGKDWSSIFPVCLLAISTYLALTTTVHPWYSILPLFLCVFTRFRYPVLWSALIVLTYINYSYPTYVENLQIVLLEYLIVYIAAIFEAFKVPGRLRYWVEN